MDNGRLFVARGVFRVAYWTWVIKSFRSAATAELFLVGKHRTFSNIAKIALRKLDLLATAMSLEDLQQPPGNHLEALKGDRAGQHSIRIDLQYRLCFTWKADGAYKIEIVGYH